MDDPHNQPPNQTTVAVEPEPAPQPVEQPKTPPPQVNDVQAPPPVTQPVPDQSQTATAQPKPEPAQAKQPANHATDSAQTVKNNSPTAAIVGGIVFMVILVALIVYAYIHGK